MGPGPALFATAYVLPALLFTLFGFADVVWALPSTLFTVADGMVRFLVGTFCNCLRAVGTFVDTFWVRWRGVGIFGWHFELVYVLVAAYP